VKISINMPTGPMLVKLQAIPQQTRGALARAMNTSVRQGEVGAVAEMRRVFDRPTPWTLGGVTSDKATPGKLEATVRVRGKTGGAIPAEAFLRSQILGGQRRFKRFEVALYRAGVLPAGYYAVPGSGARIDAFGNMSGGQIVQLLSYFAAFPPTTGGRRSNSTAESRAKMAERRRGGVVYVAIKPGNRNLFPGVYEYRDLGGLGTGVRAVLIFVRRAQYRQRFDFLGVVEKTLDQQLPRQYDSEMRAALGPGGRL
jgi:hypothetical protein